MERNLGMALRAGDPTAGMHMDAINEENIQNYFDLLEEKYRDFKNHPERQYG